MFSHTQSLIYESGSRNLIKCNATDAESGILVMVVTMP